MVEIALAYNCPLSQPTIIQYIHYNRLSNVQQMSVIKTNLEGELETRMKLLEDEMDMKMQERFIKFENDFETKSKHIDGQLETKKKDLEEQMERKIKLHEDVMQERLTYCQDNYPETKKCSKFEL